MNRTELAFRVWTLKAEVEMVGAQIERIQAQLQEVSVMIGAVVTTGRRVVCPSCGREQLEPTSGDGLCACGEPLMGAPEVVN